MDGYTYPTYQDFTAARERALRLTPDFPRALPGLQSTCIGWPTPVANPRGPLDGSSLPLVLGAAGVGDIESTRDVVAQIPGSAVVEFPGVHHGLYMSAGNRCVVAHANRYFTDRTLPPPGTVCQG
ncbi:alpha/beta hydrolase [Saccharopolyspora pogona]|uniref:alpha/beta hydrolase n=1 Tax=Saccharopolyspora pogona TaxID=333966 RepID=UPI001686277E|nr:alpha/beta hydrolase [Saccharopolyspora pogona]